MRKLADVKPGKFLLRYACHFSCQGGNLEVFLEFFFGYMKPLSFSQNSWIAVLVYKDEMAIWHVLAAQALGQIGRISGVNWDMSWPLFKDLRSNGARSGLRFCHVLTAEMRMLLVSFFS